ncbi:MAG: acetyl-coenzyme A synthetase N-terminal domain-containing protein, partial [Verrucomicrobiota bacterium]
MPLLLKAPIRAPSIIESPWLILALAVLVAFSIYLILRSKRKTMANRPDSSDANEEIADVKKASAEGFGAADRTFAPSAEFVAQARVKGMDGYRRLHERSLRDPDGFWGDEARELHWFQPWTQVLDESRKPFFR